MSVNMPERLTAENGAKSIFSGEFFESIEVSNPDFCDCGECPCCIALETPETLIQKVPVSWTTIKEIYAKAVKKYGDKNKDELLKEKEDLKKENKALLAIATSAKKYIFSRKRKRNRGDDDMCAYMSMSLCELIERNKN